MIVKYKDSAVNLDNTFNISRGSNVIYFYQNSEHYDAFEFKDEEMAQKIFSLIMERYGQGIKSLELKEQK